MRRAHALREERGGCGRCDEGLVHSFRSRPGFGRYQEGGASRCGSARRACGDKRLAETVYEYNCQSDLGQLSPGQRWGDLAFDVIANNLRSPYKVDAKPAHVEGGICACPSRSAEGPGGRGGVGSIELKVTSGNFQDFTLTVDVRAVNAKTPKLDGAVSVVGSLTYGQPLDGLTLEATFVDPDTKAEVAGTLRWTAGQDPLPAGSRQVAWEFVPESPRVPAGVRHRGRRGCQEARRACVERLDGRVYGDEARWSPPRRTS